MTVAFPNGSESPDAIRRLVDPSIEGNKGRAEMDEESFRRKLGEILGVMDAHAAEASNPASTEKDRSAQPPAWPDHLRDSVARLHVAVDQLRLRVKYLVFDLEATRRENAFLRSMLERSSRDSRRPDRDDSER
jgi:hypothetical protein